MKLKQLIKEEYQKILEIGSGTSKIYNYKIPKIVFDIMYDDPLLIKFKTDSELIYIVTVKPIVGFLHVDFKIKAKNEYAETNRGELFKVMATITSIMKDIIKINPDFKGIRYEPQAKGGKSFNTGDKGAKRDKLYRAFIKKQLGDVKFEKQGPNTFAIFK